MRNNGPVYMPPMRINLTNGRRQHKHGHAVRQTRYLELSNVPVLDFGVWWVTRQRDVDTLDMVEKNLWVVPLVRFELPCLPGGHDAYDSVPGVCSELRKGLGAVHHEIPNYTNVSKTVYS